jgi:hypothetical protein
MKPTLKAPGSEHSKVKHDVTNCCHFCFIFASNFKLHRYITDGDDDDCLHYLQVTLEPHPEATRIVAERVARWRDREERKARIAAGRGVHSSTSQLNLSQFGQ